MIQSGFLNCRLLLTDILSLYTCTPMLIYLRIGPSFSRSSSHRALKQVNTFFILTHPKTLEKNSPTPLTMRG